MIANNNDLQTSPSLSAGDLAADMKIIQGLEREIVSLKAAVKEKQTETAQLEKECGIKHQYEIVKKLEPVTVAFDNFKAKAKPVIYSASEKVRTTAKQMMKRPNVEEEEEEEEEAAPVSQEAPEKLKQEAEEQADNAVDIQKKKDKIVLLQESLTEERAIIASKDSEVAWLYKKHNLTRPNAFTKFTANVRNSASYQKMGTSLDSAKVRAKENMIHAGTKTRELWTSAGIQAGRFSMSLRSRWTKATTPTTTK